MVFDPLAEKTLKRVRFKLKASNPGTSPRLLLVLLAGEPTVYGSSLDLAAYGTVTGREAGKLLSPFI